MVKMHLLLLFRSYTALFLAQFIILPVPTMCCMRLQLADINCHDILIRTETAAAVYFLVWLLFTLLQRCSCKDYYMASAEFHTGI
jgi:hypothetical protein